MADSFAYAGRLPQDRDSGIAQPGAGFKVDVVVPVYEGLEQTRRCVESVLTALQQTPFELVLINDCSPNPGLQAYLASFQNSPGVAVLANEQNLGFVASANRGMSLHPDRDVVLLNSDTEVANDWLDRLHRCAHAALNIGTVTPFSNNATICSFPEFCVDNELPSDMSVAELDGWFARANAGKWLDIPTAVGFCMYIRRACLSQVGLFDVDAFGRGYGEENDFSLRAEKTGWRNVLAADIYVYHAGGVSFGDTREALQFAGARALREKHPEYEERVRHFILADPPAVLRRAVQIEREAARQRGVLGLSDTPADDVAIRAQPVQLHVAHDLGGGIEQWLRDFSRADRLRTNLVLRPYNSGKELGVGLALYAHPEERQPLRVWLFSRPVGASSVEHPEYRAVLADVLDEFYVGAIVVSSLIGHSLDILQTGLPTVVVCHDYFPFCPAINIHFNGICSNCDAERVQRCYTDNPDFNPFTDFSPEARLRVRERYVELLCGGKLTVVAPSRSVFSNLRRLDARFGSVPYVVIPHGYGVRLPPLPPAHNTDGRLRIVVLGMLANSKGISLLRDALDRIGAFAELYLLGSGELGELFAGRDSVHVLGGYDRENLAKTVKTIDPHVGLLMSICPETFGYTLGELMMMGVPPVATATGAFAERIRDGETGFLYASDATSMLDTLRKVDADRGTLTRIRRNLLGMATGTATAMVAEYHRLLPSGGHHALGSGDTQRVTKIQDAGLLALASELIEKHKETKSLYLKLGVKNARLVEMERQFRSVETEVRQKDQMFRDQQTLIDTIYGSTSWRASAPIRVAGRWLRALRARFWTNVVPPPATSAQASPETTAVPAVFPLPDPKIDRKQALLKEYRAALDDGMRDGIRARIRNMVSPPCISVLVPTYDTPESMLREMLDSVCNQLYPHWQLCVVDDGSSLPHVKTVLEDYATRDARIRVEFVHANGGVSRATNHALAMAEGQFTVLLDHDDMLEEQALFRVAEAVIEDRPDMLYSDEVLVSEDGESVLHYAMRPTFSPEYLRSHPYIVHLIGFRTAFLRELGGPDENLRISQDYDLILRASERATRIIHIPEVLYRWRIHEASTSQRLRDEVIQTSTTILERHLVRCGETGWIEPGPALNYFDARYPLAQGLKVAILIVAGGDAGRLRACIASIERAVHEVACDLIAVRQESDDFDVAVACGESCSRIRWLCYAGPFNTSSMCNWAVSQLGDGYTHYLFCHDDIEATESGWLGRMLEVGQKPDVGVVGAKLYFANAMSLEHAGVCVGCGNGMMNLGYARPASPDQVDTGYFGSLVCNREVSAVTGACMLVSRTVFEAIGGFDESLAVSYGDADLCLRAGQRGYRTLFCAHAVLLHHESVTRGRSDGAARLEDGMRFGQKWRELLAMGDPYFNPNLSPHNPNWQVSEPLEMRSDVWSRLFVRRGSPANVERG